jgi:hypothetical protein
MGPRWNGSKINQEAKQKIFKAARSMPDALKSAINHIVTKSVRFAARSFV